MKPFSETHTGSETQADLPAQIPNSLSDWFDDRRSIEAAEWDREQDEQHQRDILQAKTDDWSDL